MYIFTYITTYTETAKEAINPWEDRWNRNEKVRIESFIKLFYLLYGFHLQIRVKRIVESILNKK